MRVLSLVCALAVGACGSSPLPSLPEVRDDAPGSLTWVSLTTAVGAEPVEPDAVVAGQALRLVLEVRSVAAQPLAGVEAVFSVQAENFADLIRFPQGDRCLSDAQGQCSVVLVSRGGAGAFDLTARIVADPPVVETYPFVVVAEQESAHVTLDIETLGTLEWASGQGDPLAVADRVLFLDVDQPAGRLLRVRLLDGFDNPLSGRNVALEVVQDEPPATDAGPPADSGAIDSGAPSDTGALDSGLLADTGATPDAAPVMSAPATPQRAMAAQAKCSRSRSTPSRCVSRSTTAAAPRQPRTPRCCSRCRRRLMTKAGPLFACNPVRCAPAGRFGSTQAASFAQTTAPST